MFNLCLNTNSLIVVSPSHSLLEEHVFKNLCGGFLLILREPVKVETKRIFSVQHVYKLVYHDMDSPCHVR